MMVQSVIFAAAVIFSVAALANSSASASPGCTQVLANSQIDAQPVHDTLHEAAWDNDAQSLCLLLQQPDVHVNLKSDKWVLHATLKFFA
jgi:hypothetical protein